MTLIFLLRVLQAAAAINSAKALLEGCKIWFKEKYMLAVGIVNGGFYLGSGLNSYVGSVAYDHFNNFTISFLLFSVGCCLILVLSFLLLPEHEESLIPPNKNPGGPEIRNLLTAVDEDSNQSPHSGSTASDTSHSDDKCDSLTWVAVVPMLGSVSLEAMFGYTSAIVAPYLIEVFGVSISRGGFYVLVLNVATSFGSSLSGFLIQRGLLSSAQLLRIASLLGITGMWLLFPHPSLTILHSNVPYTAYVTLCLIGCADQLGAVAGFRAIEDVQVTVCGRNFGRSNRSTASSLFYTTSVISLAAGSGVCMLVIEHIDYDKGCWIIIGGLFITLTISVCLQLTLKMKQGSSAQASTQIVGLLRLQI